MGGVAVTGGCATFVCHGAPDPIGLTGFAAAACAGAAGAAGAGAGIGAGAGAAATGGGVDGVVFDTTVCPSCADAI